MNERTLRINSRLAIPLSEIELTFVRSGGPGGQNVNKVATKAVLRFDLRHSPSLSAGVRARALAQLASRLTSEGVLILAKSTHREQIRNRTAVLEQLRTMLATAVRRPRPRVPTQPTAAARERRLTAKKRRAERKRQRARVD